MIAPRILLGNVFLMIIFHKISHTWWIYRVHINKTYLTSYCKIFFIWICTSVHRKSIFEIIKNSWVFTITPLSSELRPSFSHHPCWVCEFYALATGPASEQQIFEKVFRAILFGLRSRQRNISLLSFVRNVCANVHLKR